MIKNMMILVEKVSEKMRNEIRNIKSASNQNKARNLPNNL